MCSNYWLSASVYKALVNYLSIVVKQMQNLNHFQIERSKMYKLYKSYNFMLLINNIKKLRRLNFLWMRSALCNAHNIAHDLYSVTYTQPSLMQGQNHFM